MNLAIAEPESFVVALRIDVRTLRREAVEEVIVFSGAERGVQPGEARPEQSPHRGRRGGPKKLAAIESDMWIHCS